LSRPFCYYFILFYFIFSRSILHPPTLTALPKGFSNRTSYPALKGAGCRPTPNITANRLSLRTPRRADRQSSREETVHRLLAAALAAVKHIPANNLILANRQRRGRPLEFLQFDFLTWVEGQSSSGGGLSRKQEEQRPRLKTLKYFTSPPIGRTSIILPGKRRSRESCLHILPLFCPLVGRTYPSTSLSRSGLDLASAAIIGLLIPKNDSKVPAWCPAVQLSALTAAILSLLLQSINRPRLQHSLLVAASGSPPPSRHKIKPTRQSVKNSFWLSASVPVAPVSLSNNRSCATLQPAAVPACHQKERKKTKQGSSSLQSLPRHLASFEALFLSSVEGIGWPLLQYPSGILVPTPTYSGHLYPSLMPLGCSESVDRVMLAWDAESSLWIPQFVSFTRTPAR
jgi:hypothetical protein